MKLMKYNINVNSRIKEMRKNIFIVLILATTNIYSQNIQTNSGLQNAFSAYGFLLGQEYFLNKVKTDYQNLNLDATQAELMFNISFRKAKGNIENHFISKFSLEELNQFKVKLYDEFLKLNINTLSTEQNAIKFIDEVKNKSKGEINSPLKEILLFYNFETCPEQEFLEGYTQIFNTHGHYKSKGSDWSIKVPISWVAKEADRPNIIQKFISEGGIGNENIMLMVKNFPNKISANQVVSFFTEKEIKGMMPPGAKFIQFKKMVYDGINGGYLEYEQTAIRLDFEITTNMSQYIFIYNQKLYTLNCNIKTTL